MKEKSCKSKVEQPAKNTYGGLSSARQPLRVWKAGSQLQSMAPDPQKSTEEILRQMNSKPPEFDDLCIARLTLSRDFSFRFFEGPLVYNAYSFDEIWLGAEVRPTLQPTSHKPTDLPPTTP